MNVATGLAIGHKASPDLAAQAVSQAMQAANISIASSVLLFLTAEFARDPLPALRAAARAASCTQIMGCSATGIFTEQDWVIDAPAAAAMVFSGAVSLELPGTFAAQQLILSLAAPNAINTTWLSAPGIHFGGVSGDATGQGPFSVWQHGRGAAAGHCEAALKGVHGAVAAAHGLRILNHPQLVMEVREHDINGLVSEAALDALKHAYHEYGQQQVDATGHELPLHRLMAVFADSAEAIIAGDYQLATLVSTNEANGDQDSSVTLARPVKPGQFLSWAIREPETALINLQQTADQLRAGLTVSPDFGLLFSCLGRGPYFYGGLDRDLMLLRQRFPGMPLIGFYGNGEIASVASSLSATSELLQYSAVLGLFAEGERDVGLSQLALESTPAELAAALPEGLTELAILPEPDITESAIRRSDLPQFAANSDSPRY